ncbi:Rrf2 family transcriptional regulator [Alcanivorax quisquiliarum]|uniref:Rrf2 family transcriptional regulator n=1 Tax=Alcanivorax quisquiliarum TaxID=2933565 RepID=A0ABT0EAK1_9GAMM|nr:Rrf2 family transcriptional regulator [Alcanivorax quisquiliarum]MCK0538773.1 Rrf2 family transcriptional regulator [Alcanivorax quisquiliarum]
MRLTLHTDYALRVLIYLGLQQEGRLATIREISQAYDISRTHLMKVALELQKRGYIEAVRGRAGGLALAAPGAAVNLGQLVRELEPDLALAECMGGENRCVISPDCRLKEALHKAREAFIAVLGQYTVADLTAPGKRAAALRGHLQIINL